MQRYRELIVFFFAALLCGCEGTSFQSSVPAYPVRISIDTRVGPFVHFQPTAATDYIIVDKTGYNYKGTFVQPLGATDMYGYAGVLVYVNMLGGYDAYDLCCPHCAALRQPCHIDGLFAVCPLCDEHYDLSSGTAAPQKGIAHEYLRRLNIINTDGKLIISQRQ